MLEKQKRGMIDQSTTYDTKTGEVEEGSLVWIPKKSPSLFGKEWFQMAQSSLKTINQFRKQLGAEGLAVFNALLYRLDFENYILINQADICKELEMKPPNVSRAVRRLEEFGFIKRGPKSGKSSTFRLHPEVAWKGKPKAHHTAREEARKMGWKIIDSTKQNDDQPDLPFDI